MEYLNILLLAIIVVFVVDISGIIDTCKDYLGKWLNIKVGRLRPLDCSLCMTFWVCLIYAICVGAFSISMLAYIALLSFLSMRIADLMRLADDLLCALINKITKRL